MRMGGRFDGAVKERKLNDTKHAAPPATKAVMQVSALIMHAVVLAAASRANEVIMRNRGTEPVFEKA